MKMTVGHLSWVHASSGIFLHFILIHQTISASLALCKEQIPYQEYWSPKREIDFACSYLVDFYELVFFFKEADLLQLGPCLVPKIFPKIFQIPVTSNL
jgi:hypothetical protein